MIWLVPGNVNLLEYLRSLINLFFPLLFQVLVNQGKVRLSSRWSEFILLLLHRVILHTEQPKQPLLLLSSDMHNCTERVFIFHNTNSVKHQSRFYGMSLGDITLCDACVPCVMDHDNNPAEYINIDSAYTSSTCCVCLAYELYFA